MTTPAYTNGSDYTWVGPATGGYWTDASNWQYDGEAATHAPDSNTNSNTGPLVIPAGVTVTIPASATNLGYINLDVKGTLIVADGSSPLQFTKLTVENGGQAIISRTLNINGGLIINDGGTATFKNTTQDWTNPTLNLSLLQGGTLDIDHSNIVLNNVNQGQGEGALNITNGSVVSTATSSTNISGPITVTGSSFTDKSKLTGTLTLNDGATATLATGSWPTGTVVFGTGNNTLVLPSDNYGAQSLTLQNLKQGDRLGIDGSTVNSVTLASSNLSVEFPNPGTTSQPPIITNSLEAVTYDSSFTTAPTEGETQTTALDNGQAVVCFLAGSMIATPNGAVAVENIRQGDEVLAFAADGTPHARQVVWAGTAQATVNPALPDDMAGWPVRIVADAFAPGVPHQDLLVTAEHCIFASGHLVPVRMLVNGSSIFYDRTITTYSYYHVETAQHSIIMANGMLTESYLDTGNRSSFVSDGNVVTLGAKPKNWAEHAAAPLGVARPLVEPLWRMLAARAPDVAGHQPAPAAPETTTNPDLHLVTPAGRVIRPLRVTGAHVSFMLPADTQAVHLVSRSARMCDIEGPFVDDRHNRGVLVGRVTVLAGGQTTPLTPHLDTAITSPQNGWLTAPHNNTRWTDGNALLPLGTTTAHGPALLTVEVHHAGPYSATVADTAPLQARAANG